ncbi:MAG: MFS transporter, partial [Anaerolineaceae bacterium]
MIQRAIRWYDYITINIYWFALTTRAQVLTPLILPLLVQQFVGDAAKGTYLGNIRLLALMVALLFQSMMGLISDRSTLPLGRRRPFIIIGTVGEIIVFVLIGFTAGMEGMTGYWFLFALYTLSMLSSNTAHAATQALIPDLVPEDKRGSFSGVKALLELPVPLIFVSFVVGKMVSAGNIWGAILSVIAVMIVCAAITMFVPEKRLIKSPTPMDWKPILRLLLMTAVFTLIILGTGKLVNWVMNLSDGLQGSASMIVTGLVGLAGMAVAIGLGVWSSVQISVGNEAKTNPSFTWWVTNRLAFLAGSTNLASFMIYFLQERFINLQGEKAAGPASTIIMFVGVFILLTALPSGWLSDRFGKKTIIAVAALL